MDSARCGPRSEPRLTHNPAVHGVNRDYLSTTTMLSNSSRQHVVLFDAVGTLIYPDPPAFEVYHSIGSDHGSKFTQDQILCRFFPAFKKHFLGQANQYDVLASEPDERQKWQCVVQDVFDHDYSNELFDQLWNHFSQAENWGCFADADEVLQQLIERDILVCVASNFDSRLNSIITDNFREFSEHRIFCSTQVGFAKPDVRFFKRIESVLAREFGLTSMMMVGDNWRFDVEAPRRAGWRSIWKSNDRLPAAATISSHFFRKT